ncbi:MAG: hypothetical protein LBM38_04140 [Clostridiales bacterium]|jgi:epoxyqueuosine reductase|nr:hypothetical protein [Clostridiales bacterium]
MNQLSPSTIQSIANSLHLNAQVGVAQARVFTELEPILHARPTPFVRADIQQRINPFLVLPDAKSIIALAFGYLCNQPDYIPAPSDDTLPKFRRGGNYRNICKDRLKLLWSKIESQITCDPEPNPNLAPGAATSFKAKFLVDSGRLHERHIAKIAGLGWIGMNNLLYNPRFGFECYLGLIVTNLDIAPTSPIASGCTHCRECLNRCPTHALGEYSLDYTKCISYLAQTDERYSHLSCDKCVWCKWAIKN